MSTLSLLVIVAAVLFTVIRFTPRQAGGVPLVRKRVHPLLRTGLAVAGVAAIAAVIGITLKDLNTRLAEPSQLALTLQRPVRSLAERYPAAEGTRIEIQPEQLLVQFLEVSQEQRILAVNTQTVAWTGQSLDLEWKYQPARDVTVTCSVTLDTLGIQDRNGVAVIRPGGNWRVETRRSGGQGSSSSSFNSASSERPTYLKLARSHVNSRSSSGQLLSFLSSGVSSMGDSTFALLLEPLPTPDEALETRAAQECIPTLSPADRDAADEALKVVTDRNNRNHRSHATRNTPPVLLLLRHSGPALLLLLAAAILIAFAIKPYSMSVGLALLALVAVLPPLADQFAVQRASGILRDKGAPFEQRSAAARLLSNSFFWGETARSALTGVIAPESPPTVILRARRELLEVELSREAAGNWNRHVPSASDYDHDIGQWTHTYLVRNAQEKSVAIIVSPSDHNFGFGFNNLPAAMVATEDASGLLFANWRNLLTADPVFEQLGTEDDFRQLAKVRPNQSFNPSGDPLWKTLVTPRIREYVEAER